MRGRNIQTHMLMSYFLINIIINICGLFVYTVGFTAFQSSLRYSIPTSVFTVILLQVGNGK